MPPRSATTSLNRSVRDQNAGALLRLLLREPMGRKELARRTGISLTTITRLTAALLAAGVLEELSARVVVGRGKGRPEIPLGIAAGGRLAVGVQIRGSRVTAAAYGLSGIRLAAVEAPHDGGAPERVVATAIELTRRLIDDVGPARVAGVGVSTGGVVDFESGTLLSSPQLGWRNVPLRGPMARAVGRPVVVDTSVRSLAVSRLWTDPAAPDSMLVVFVAGIVASALVLERRLQRGAHATAGALAHTPVAGGPRRPCPCGSVDCLGLLATDRAVQRTAIAEGWLSTGSSWDDIYAGGSPSARNGLAGLRRERAGILGRSVGRLAEFLDPYETVVAGRIGTDEEVRLCLDAIGAERGARHWPVTDEDWDRGAASLLVDDYLTCPTRYEPTLSI
ncbi:ROK family protein [Streptomyces endophyticus]|uniref:ROK family protein n=1 Tax=Streptomyces endophyticus TaxID=714166 RepID=A0ABU6FA88_9ACTN|nr:ROK family protein [Streptomyces endophyticus]MEB8340744.1 ROK family protein [Streptomyces endophyticus]